MEDLHRVVTRQNVLTRLIGLPKEERRQAQAVKKENTSGGAAADPRTVLVSHVGNGSGGSQPSTDLGSWPQVRFCLRVCSRRPLAAPGIADGCGCDGLVRLLCPSLLKGCNSLLSAEVLTADATGAV